MIFCARATHGLRRPSPVIVARFGVPVGGRVRKLRAVEDQSAPIPESERVSVEGRGVVWSIPRARCPRTEDQLDCQIKGRARSMRAVRNRSRPPP